MTFDSDGPTLAAWAKASKAHRRALAVWAAAREARKLAGDDAGEDALESEEEVESLAADALMHLEAGRWDEALACAEEALSLAESACASDNWREFGLLLEEAAETGRERGDVLELS